MTADAGPSITDAQRDAAARWLTRLDSGAASPAERARFDAWLAADARHAAAFEETKRLWQRLEAPAHALAAARVERMAALLARARSRRAPTARPRTPRPATWAGASLAAAALLLALWMFAPSLDALRQDMAADIVTARGETRSVALPDGSRVQLGPDSALVFAFDAAHRGVELLRGEAFFEVRHGDSPAFTVDTGGSHVRVVGTRFDVRRSGTRTDVAVEDGVVEVSGAAAAVARLVAGQRVVVDAGRLGTVAAADLDAVLAWRQSRLVFYREPLSRVVAELERQRDGRIVIARASLGDLKVSGAFPTKDTDRTLAAIADTLDVRVVSVTPWLTVLY
jgi:transmembrane sensor